MVKLFTVCHDGITGSLLHVVVSFSLGSVSEVVECIQVYYTALYRPHGSTDITSKTMHHRRHCTACVLSVILSTLPYYLPYTVKIKQLHASQTTACS